jgi:hypothetical protein
MSSEARIAPVAALTGIQRHLESIYDLDAFGGVDQYLTTDAELARLLDDGAGARETGEKLLVREEENGIAVSLYIDATVMAVLAENDPLRSLNEDNLAEFLTALEGVSHFLYLVWNVRHGRGVSLFELELQAEVDKFAVAAMLLARQRRFRVPRRLHERLFAAPSYDARLDREEQRRYRAANDYAAKYCERLRRDCLQDRRTSLVRELRRFYRLTSRHKLAHIARAS